MTPGILSIRIRCMAIMLSPDDNNQYMTVANIVAAPGEGAKEALEAEIKRLSTVGLRPCMHRTTHAKAMNFLKGLACVEWLDEEVGEADEPLIVPAL